MFFTVKQNHVVLIERLGKYARTAKEGMRMTIPFLERIKEYPDWVDELTQEPRAHKEGGQMELSVQQTDTPKRTTQTRDSVTVEADASIYWRITDPVKAAYDVDVLPKAIADSALNALRGQIGKLELADLIANRQVINEAISSDLLEISKSWGIVVTRVEVQEIKYNDDTAKAMLQEMEAERKKRAQIFEAQGIAESILLQANAQAEAIKVIADAEQIYLEKLGGTKGALNIILAQKYLNGMETITKNPADKVFIPNSYQTLIGLSDDTSGG